MKKNILKVAFVAAIALVSGVNVFNSQKTKSLSDVVLANVEALASNLEASGIPWDGYAYNWEERCCKRTIPSAECSGSYFACPE